MQLDSTQWFQAIELAEPAASLCRIGAISSGHVEAKDDAATPGKAIAGLPEGKTTGITVEGGELSFAALPQGQGYEPWLVVALSHQEISLLEGI